MPGPVYVDAKRLARKLAREARAAEHHAVAAAPAAEAADVAPAAAPVAVPDSTMTPPGLDNSEVTVSAPAPVPAPDPPESPDDPAVAASTADPTPELASAESASGEAIPAVPAPPTTPNKGPPSATNDAASPGSRPADASGVKAAAVDHGAASAVHGAAAESSIPSGDTRADWSWHGFTCATGPALDPSNDPIAAAGFLVPASTQDKHQELQTQTDDTSTAVAADSPNCGHESNLIAANAAKASAHPTMSSARSDSSHPSHLPGAATLTSVGPSSTTEVRTSLLVISSLFFII